MKKTLNKYKGGIQSNLSTLPKKNKIDWNIDIKSEKNILKAFDKFIEKWCGQSSAHLLDNDEQDGEFMRDKIRKLLVKQHQSIEKTKFCCNSCFADKCLCTQCINKSNWIGIPIEESKDIKKSNFKKYWLKKTGWNFTKFNEGDIYLENKLNKVIKKLNSLSKENK